MVAQVPAALARFPEIARNLWWTWHPEAEALFDSLRGTGPEPPHRNALQLLDALAPGAIMRETPRGSRRSGSAW